LGACFVAPVNYFSQIKVLIAALFTIAKVCKQPSCPTTNEWIKKMYLYMMEFYSPIKKNEILSFADKWLELENINLSEVT
jgi:hypothetical protein